ncbi:MAG: TrgA family protein, partial [Paracoccaceae bacterium]
MPKVIAAVFFAALGYFAADLVLPLLPEGTRAKWLNETLAGVGAISGWIMSGARAGDGTRAGFGYGLTTVVLIIGWGVFLFAGAKMLEFSIDRRYDGPMEALQSMFAIGIGYLRLIAVPEIAIAAIVGGLFGGWL